MSMIDMLVVDPASVPVPNAGTVYVYIGGGGLPRVKQADGTDSALTGPAGQVGATGAAGAAGAAGAQGVAGTVGPVGATGAAGAQGVAGPVGPVGATGAAGAQGVAGPVGPVGATGAAGAQGVAGPVGPVGATGADGAQGAGLSGGSVADLMLANTTAYQVVKSISVAAGQFVPGKTVASIFAALQIDAAAAGVLQLAMRVNGGPWANIAALSYKATTGGLVTYIGSLWALASGAPMAVGMATISATLVIGQVVQGTATGSITGACTLDFGVQTSNVTTALSCRALNVRWGV
jgi:hypothetical protein